MRRAGSIGIRLWIYVIFGSFQADAEELYFARAAEQLHIEQSHSFVQENYF